MIKDYYKDEYVVVDIETTGLYYSQGHEIIEIGVTEIKKGDIRLNYSRLVKPKGIISSTITNLTHISNEMVENEKTIEEVLPKFREYIGDRVVIAHNAKFDVPFLNYYLEKIGLEPIKNYICTLEMLKENKMYPLKKKNLSTACDFYGIKNVEAHRAYADTHATALLFLKIRDEI